MEEISKTYSYHKPSPDGLERIIRLRQAFILLDMRVRDLAPESRERAIAITNIEQAAMWAIKSVLYNDPKSVVVVE